MTTQIQGVNMLLHSTPINTFDMRLKILLLLILSNAHIILASDVVVLDSITREPIPFAHLLVKENGLTQSYPANLDGLIEYESTQIELKPEFTFKASFYAEKKYRESVPDTVMLMPSQNLLNEVVVSGQREFTKLSPYPIIRYRILLQ